MNDAETVAIECPSSSPSSSPSPEFGVSRTRRRLLPRFGLRFLFVFAVLFCLFFAWIGRNVVRMRQEEAAIETLLQANARIVVAQDQGLLRKETALPAGLAPHERTFRYRFGRAIGWTEPPRIARVRIESDQTMGPKVTRQVAALLVFPDLRKVELRGRAFDDRTIEQVAKLDSLQSLSLENTTITAEGLRTLSSHESLRSLTLDADFWGELTRAAASLKSLERVSLSGMAIDQGDVAAIASLPKLKELSIASVPLYIDLLAPLEGATSLERFTLESSGDGGTPTVSLPPLPRLERLKATGVAISELPSLPKLERCDVDGLTDETLAAWDAPPGLRHIALHFPITEQAAREFGQDHPDCAVTYHADDGTMTHRQATNRSLRDR